MKLLLRFATRIDTLNTWIGHGASWLILVCVLTSATTATLRYVFDWGSNALLEGQWFMFGLVFLFCAAWALREGAHVRIDILFSHCSPRAQVWIDLLGGLLFLLPICLLIVFHAWHFFLLSFQTGETSSNPGGLVWWPIKLAIPIAFLLLSLQGIAQSIKNLAMLTGHLPMPEAATSAEH